MDCDGHINYSICMIGYIAQYRNQASALLITNWTPLGFVSQIVIRFRSIQSMPNPHKLFTFSMLKIA